MKWLRTNSIEQLDKVHHRKRSYLYSLPVLRKDLSNYFDYDIKSELGISLVIMDCGLRTKKQRVSVSRVDCQASVLVSQTFTRSDRYGRMWCRY